MLLLEAINLEIKYMIITECSKLNFANIHDISINSFHHINIKYCVFTNSFYNIFWNVCPYIKFSTQIVTKQWLNLFSSGINGFHVKLSFELYPWTVTVVLFTEIKESIILMFCCWYHANLGELIDFYSPWNHQKTRAFLIISGGT